MREKLIELLNQGADNTPCDSDCWDKKCNDCIRETQADHLIANGVTIPVRCKDCKHGILDEDEGLYRCVYDAEYDEKYGEYFGFIEYNDGEHFCSRGERRTDER